MGDLNTPKFHFEINWPLLCISAIYIIEIVQILKIVINAQKWNKILNCKNLKVKSNVKLYKWRYWVGFLPSFSNVIWQTIFLHSLGRDQKLQEKNPIKRLVYDDDISNCVSKHNGRNILKQSKNERIKIKCLKTRFFETMISPCLCTNKDKGHIRGHSRILWIKRWGEGGQKCLFLSTLWI